MCGANETGENCRSKNTHGSPKKEKEKKNTHGSKCESIPPITICMLLSIIIKKTKLPINYQLF